MRVTLSSLKPHSDEMSPRVVQPIRFWPRLGKRSCTASRMR